MSQKTPLGVRRSADRGTADFGWLQSRHSFSFGQYYDPQMMGFGPLRVINDDEVGPGRGFGAHPHSDMEIISLVTRGNLEHRDSLGNGDTLSVGEVQYMSAGSGVVHSEYNPSSREPVHFFQIWIQPNVRGAPPRYAKARVDLRSEETGWTEVAGPEGSSALLSLRQDAWMLVGRAGAGNRLEHSVAPGRGLWLHVAAGKVRVGDAELDPGDAIGLGEGPVTVEAETGSLVLGFDVSLG